MYTTTQLNKRKKKTRNIIKKNAKYRLTVYKSNKHTYIQLYNNTGSKIITSISTLDKTFKEILNKEKNTHFTKINKAELIANIISKIIKEKNIKNIAFDRSGLKFHGRIKKIATIIKENEINY